MKKMKLTKETKAFFRKDETKSKFCIEAKISRPTLVRRFMNPSSFRASEIEVLKKMSGIEKVFE